MGNVTIVTWRRTEALGAILQSMGSSAAILELFPAPGEWTEDDYFEVSDRGRLVEFSDGNIELLPLPIYFHQIIIGRLYKVLDTYVLEHRLGAVSFAPLPVKLRPGKFREPDLIFMARRNRERIGKYWGVPDLTVEVISDGGEDHDRRVKRNEYAEAGVSEYWIIDPIAQTLEVLCLADNTFVQTALLGNTDVLTSQHFPGWSYRMADMFAAPPLEED